MLLGSTFRYKVGEVSRYPGKKKRYRPTPSLGPRDQGAGRPEERGESFAPNKKRDRFKENWIENCRQHMRRR